MYQMTFTDKEIFEQGHVKTPLFSLEGQTMIAKVVKVYDADTIHIVLPLFDKLMKFKTRFIGIDSAEIKSKDLAEKAHARNSRDILKAKILNRLVKVECGEFDKYGRLLVKVFPYKVEGEKTLTPATDETTQEGGSKKKKAKATPILSSEGDPALSYNDWLVQEKHAYVYDGGTKQKFPDWTL